MSGHIVPARVYYRVFAGLLALTLATVAMAFVDLGEANTITAITIAVGKGLLVVLFFMHVKYTVRLVWVFAAGGFCWLIILLALTLGDVLTRDWIPAPTAW
jgi:cytochrome c oxidase subunit 4